MAAGDLNGLGVVQKKKRNLDEAVDLHLKVHVLSL